MEAKWINKRKDGWKTNEKLLKNGRIAMKNE